MKTATPAAHAEPHIKRWTRDEYYKMGEAGLFEDKRVELIDGEIVEMSPQGAPHAITIGLIQNALGRIFTLGSYWVRIQLPLDLGAEFDPEPEFAVVPGSPRDAVAGMHPSSALLVIEVALSSLNYDRAVKGSLYAQAGIQDYWIVNLMDRQLEVYRKPCADPAARFGFSYASTTLLKAGATAAPLALPAAAIAISDLLP